MHVLNTAAIFASEAAEGSGSTPVPGWVWGVGTMILFIVLLIATMMIKVGRD